MTVKNIQSELQRIKKYYQMFGEDAEVIDEAIEKLNDCNAKALSNSHLLQGRILLCPQCGLEVHSDFVNCPRCGERMDCDADFGL